MEQKILIIDKESAYLSVLVRSLANHDFQVNICSTEMAINDYLKHNTPNLILIDVLVNNQKGLEILQSFKSNYFLSVPFIVISEAKEIELIEKAFEHGAYDYLIKPLNLKDLKNKIINALKSEYLKLNNCHA